MTAVISREQRIVIEKVIAERLKQDAKWGIQRHSPLEWSAILTETRKYIGEMEPRTFEGQMRICKVCARKQFKRTTR